MRFSPDTLPWDPEAHLEGIERERHSKRHKRDSGLKAQDCLNQDCLNVSNLHLNHQRNVGMEIARPRFPAKLVMVLVVVMVLVGVSVGGEDSRSVVAGSS